EFNQAKIHIRFVRSGNLNKGGLSRTNSKKVALGLLELLQQREESSRFVVRG
ncbi:hypothetical protein ACLOJK_004983, partial [Asimina triloba]